MSVVNAPPKTKKAAPKKEAAHPSFKVMIAKAIAEAKSRTGVSRQAILKYIEANYKVDKTALPNLLRQQLKRLVAAGLLAQPTSGSFKVTDKLKADLKPKKAKKPAAKKVTKKPKKAVKKAKKAAKPKKAAAAKKTAAAKPKKAASAKPKKAAAPKKAASKPKKAAAGAKKAAAKPKKAAAKKPAKKAAAPAAQ